MMTHWASSVTQLVGRTVREPLDPSDDAKFTAFVSRYYLIARSYRPSAASQERLLLKARTVVGWSPSMRRHLSFSRGTRSKIVRDPFANLTDEDFERNHVPVKELTSKTGPGAVKGGQ